MQTSEDLVFLFKNLALNRHRGRIFGKTIFNGLFYLKKLSAGPELNIYQ